MSNKSEEIKYKCSVCTNAYESQDLFQCEHKECDADKRILCLGCIEFVHKTDQRKQHSQKPISMKTALANKSITQVSNTCTKSNKIAQRSMVSVSVSKSTRESQRVSTISSLSESSKILCEGCCRQSYSSKNVFLCQHKDCANDRAIFCKTCGRINHQWKSHSFITQNEYIVSVKQLIKPDSKEFDDGRIDGALLVRGMTPIEDILWYTRWVGALTAHGAHMGGTFGTSMVVNGAPTVSAACGVGNSVVFSALAVSAVGGVLGSLVGTAFEGAFIWNRYAHGIIKKQEAMSLTARALLANGISTAAFLSFMAIGAAAGTPGGPIGWIVGSAIGAIIFGILTRLGTNKLTENHFKKKHVRRSELQKEALEFFFHNENYDISDERKFNEKLLRRRYRKLATICHPDRKDGDHSEWLKLSAYYGILTAMCDKQNGNEPKSNRSRGTLAIGLKEYQQSVAQLIEEHGDLNPLILKNIHQDYADGVTSDDGLTITNAETFDQDGSDETNPTTTSISIMTSVSSNFSHLGTESQHRASFGINFNMSKTLFGVRN